MKATDTQTINRYAYVKNNPTNSVDPSGEFPSWVRSAVRATADWLIRAIVNPIETVSDAGPNRCYSPINQHPVATEVFAGLVFVGGGEFKGGGEAADAAMHAFSTRGFGNIVAGAKYTADEALSFASRWLGPEYMEIGGAGSGVFRSLDGLRQFRMTAGDLLGLHGGAPHVNIEAIDLMTGEAVENLHLFLK